MISAILLQRTRGESKNAGWTAAFRMSAMGLLFISTTAAQAQKMDSDVLDRAKRASVMVRTSSSKNSEGDTLFGTGSGFFVNSNGLCITNNHVVDPGHHKTQAEKFDLKQSMNRLVWEVVTRSGTPDEEKWRADVLYQNEQADLAVLQVKDEDGNALEWDDYIGFVPTSQVSEGMKAWCLGFPGGDSRKNSQDFPEVAVTSGNVVSLPRTTSGRITMIETDVLANQGNSGGPFIDESGKLIGVLTLGFQTEARTNTTMLIPADLVQEMIGTAFRRSKVPLGADIKPFYNVFVSRNGVWKLPFDSRMEEMDCVTLDGSGSRACGDVKGSSITWSTKLGNIEIPISAMAYFLKENERRGMVFLDGGDRVPVELGRAHVEFTPEGGTTMDLALADVKWIAFHKPEEPPTSPKGVSFVIEADSLRLSLLNVAGEVKFRSDFGGQILNVPVNAMDRIDREGHSSILYTTSGSRFSGQFDDHEITGKLSWSGSPVKISFSDMAYATISRIDYQETQEAQEVNLANSLETSDPRLVRIASLLDNNDVHTAEPLLDTLLEDHEYKTMAREKKDQLRFLQGEYLLKSGKYDEAASVFKKLRRAKVDDVLWHSRARLAVLERYGDGKFQQGEISQSEVFGRAARSLAREFREEAAHGLDGIENSEPDSRGEYLKLNRRAKQLEEMLLIANRLTGGESDELLLHLWRITRLLQRTESARLSEQLTVLQEQSNDRSTRGKGGRPLTDSQRRRIDQKITQTRRDIEAAQEAGEELQIKIRQAGFIIDDPDLVSAGDE